MDFQGVKKADVELVGLDGNAFMVIGAVCKGLKRAGNDKAVVDAVREEMMAGDYDHLLQVAIQVTA